MRRDWNTLAARLWVCVDTGGSEQQAGQNQRTPAISVRVRNIDWIISALSSISAAFANPLMQT